MSKVNYKPWIRYRTWLSIPLVKVRSVCMDAEVLFVVKHEATGVRCETMATKLPLPHLMNGGKKDDLYPYTFAANHVRLSNIFKYVL